MHSSSFFGNHRRRLLDRRGYLRMGLMSGAILAGLAATGCGWHESSRYHWGGWRHDGWADDPAAAKEQTRHMVRWVLRSVDATDDQRSRIDAIVGRLVDDMQPIARAHSDNREAMVAALTAEAVDRQAIERARQSDLDLAAKGYARFTDAFAEIAEILTREQRIELAEAAQRFRRWH